MGTVEVTEFDDHFDSLADRADKTKKWTEKLVSNTEAVLQPNPSEYQVTRYLTSLVYLLLMNDGVIRSLIEGISVSSAMREGEREEYRRITEESYRHPGREVQSSLS